jgi:hypothetical protein
MAPYVTVLDHVIALLQGKLATQRAIEELTRELTLQLQEQARTGRSDREQHTARLAELDRKIAEAVANLAHTPADLQADVAAYVRQLKAERDIARQELQNLDAAERENRGISPEDLQATLEMVRNLSAAMDTRQDAELLRAALRDLVREVRLYWRPRRAGEKLPRGRQATKRLLRRVEVDLSPCFADLLTMGSRSSIAPRTS